MKTINVTVEEFLANGGKLEKGRELYGESEYKGMIMRRSSKAIMPVYNNICCVKIEVTPIYK